MNINNVKIYLFCNDSLGSIIEQDLPIYCKKKKLNLVIIKSTKKHKFKHNPSFKEKIKNRIKNYYSEKISYFKSKITGINPWLGAIRVMLIGAMAAAAAFGVARLFEGK